MCKGFRPEHNCTIDADANIWGSNEEVMAYLRRFKHCTEPPAGITVKYKKIQEENENEKKNVV